MSAAVAISTIAIEHLPLQAIRASPLNPRKTFRGIEELAGDITTRGILQPLTVRLVSDHYEIVFGERRWRAAKKAELETVPCIIRSLSDAEALELMLVELALSEGVHPVEEAEAYKALSKTLSVKEIADRLGKSVGFIYGRLKLCELPEVARKAAMAGELPASHALLIARIPNAAMQAEVTPIIAGNKDREPMSYRQACELVQRDYMLRLEDAPWSKTDATLLPAAGACSKCVKRTGNQPELFADVKSADVCTDPGCFKEKRAAFTQLRVHKAREAGQEVLEGEAAAKLFTKWGDLEQRDQFVDLSETEWHAGKEIEQAALLPKNAPKPVLAVDEKGDVHELMPRAIFDKLAAPALAKAEKAEEKQREANEKKHVATLTPEQKAKQAEYAKAQKEREEKEAREEKIALKLTARAEEGVPDAAWPLLAHVLAGSYDTDSVRDRREWKADSGGDEGELHYATEIAKLTHEEARGFVIECILSMRDRGNEGLFVELARVFAGEAAPVAKKPAKKPTTKPATKPAPKKKR